MRRRSCDIIAESERNRVGFVYRRGHKSLSPSRKLGKSLKSCRLMGFAVASASEESHRNCGETNMFHELATPFWVSLRELLILIALLSFTLWSLLRYTQDWRNERSRFLKLGNRLPGPPNMPMIGNALSFVCKPEKMFDRLVDIIKPYEGVTPMRAWLGPVLYVIITSPRDIEPVLNSQQALCKGMAYKLLFPFIGDGLISGSGKAWKSHRKLVSRTLTPRVICDYVDVFDRHSRILIEKLKLFADGRVFDILEALEGCTIDIVCEAVMGFTDISAQDNPDHEFIKATTEMYAIVYNRMMKVWLYPDSIFRLTHQYKKQCNSKKIVNDFIEKCIAATRKVFEASKLCGIESRSHEYERRSILERILEINSITHELNDEDLRDEIFTVYLAAQDTVALTCSFASLMLGMHQDAQKKARQEIQEILMNDESITVESLNRMKYVEMIIKETLRLFPIAPFMVRGLKDELALDSCTLPKGCQVMIASYITHRSNIYWKNPERFDPERFSIDETSKRHSFSYMPFSGGPMGCIGQKFALLSLKTILANLLRNYKITSKVKMEDIKLRNDISIRSVNGYKVSLEPLSGHSRGNVSDSNHVNSSKFL